MLGRFFRTAPRPGTSPGHDGRHDGRQDSLPAGREEAAAFSTLPLFPTRDETIERSFDRFMLRTAHDTVLVAEAGSRQLHHQRNPAPERILTLYRSRFIPGIALLVSPEPVDLHKGTLLGPLLPLLVVDRPETSHVALRSPLGQIHLCALEVEENRRLGDTDFYRHWIGPWESFRLEPHPQAVLRPQTQAALAQIGLMLEKDLAASDVLVQLRDMSAETSALVTPIIVHLLSRHHAAPPAVAAPVAGAASADRPVWGTPVMSPRLDALRLIDRIDAAAAPVPEGRLRGSWTLDDAGRPCAAGQKVDIDIRLERQPAFARLRLDIEDCHHPVTMTVLVDNWQVGKTALVIQKHRGSRLDYWIPAEALQAVASPGTLTVSLVFDRMEPRQHLQFPFHFRLKSCSVHVGPDAPRVEMPHDAGALLACFESLGDDCEFGFVQRHFGVERLGVFTFAGVRHLVHTMSLLENRFEGLGEPGTLEANETIQTVYRDPQPPEVTTEFYMLDRRYELHFHTWKGPQEISREESLKENETKLRFLRRKFLEDLEDGEKIFIFKDVVRQDANEIIALHDVMMRYGTVRLFWVTRPIEGRTAGMVEWVAPNLLRGYSANSHAEAQRFNPDHWLELCQAAFRAFAREQQVGAPEVPALPRS